MQYSGDLNDVCPISFTPVAEIERPVGFDSVHAFECHCIVEWLTKHRCINPVTSEVIGAVPISSVLQPLIIDKIVDASELQHTIQILCEAGTAIDSESPDKTRDEVLRVHCSSISHALVFNALVWLFSMGFIYYFRIHGNFSHVIEIIICIISMVYFTVETLARYPLNGKQILLGLFSISIFIWSYIAISGLSSEDFTWRKMFVLVQGTVIVGRFYIDKVNDGVAFALG